MLPGYVIDTSTLQNHIHLGYAARDGSSPVGMGTYGEPPYMFHGRRRTPQLTLNAAFTESWDGTPHDHVLLNPITGMPVTKKGYVYDLRVTLAELDVLYALTGNRVYFIDNRHCPDSSDHTQYIKLMYLENVSYNDSLNPVLEHNLITISLRDMYTVAPE